jgi:hypothetical protein
MSMTWDAAVALLDVIPGVDRRVAEVMLAGMGVEIGRPDFAQIAALRFPPIFPTDEQ